MGFLKFIRYYIVFSLFDKIGIEKNSSLANFIIISSWISSFLIVRFLYKFRVIYKGLHGVLAYAVIFFIILLPLTIIIFVFQKIHMLIF